MNKLSFSVEFDFQPENNPDCKTLQQLCKALEETLNVGFVEFMEAMVDFFYKDNMCPLLDQFCDEYNADIGCYSDDAKMTNELPKVYTEEFLEVFRVETTGKKQGFDRLFKVKNKTFAFGSSGPRVYFDIEETARLAKFREQFQALKPKVPEPTEEAEIAELKRLLKKHGKQFLGLAD